jgi:membrane-bound metal-dependent hydrolase YbcI (DUF457 family)
MDSLFHFIFPMIAALAAKIHVKHGLETVIGLSLAAVLIDLDVFFIHRATFHNLFLTALLPLVIIALVFRYRPRNAYLKMTSIALFLFLISHTVLDLFTEAGVALLYPLSSQFYTMDINVVVATPLGQSSLVTSAGVGLTLYFAIILAVLFVEDFLVMSKRERKLRRCFEDTLKKEIKKNI